ncbi:hypothetical protein [Ruegeria lacuscaerulensis]|uniref:hypothetical protein n=1 Tax=Ruegeria lacuscaerulensis TaxID=55218 RepID=UPI00147DA82F|nr:hypothetical protein [Ruegeria lacuscaerulensis]
MSNTTQKYLRFLIPGMLGYFALYFVCQACDFCSIGWPTSFDEVMKLTAVLLIAFFYDFLRLRKLSNSFPQFQVNAGIMDHLKGPFVDQDQRISGITWRRFKDVYYPIIDNDETLKLRSENIRFNGVLWSSAADLRAIAALGFLVIFVFYFAQKMGIYDGFVGGELMKSGVIFLVLFVVSFPVSWVLTNKHREMVLDQCDYMLLHKRGELEKGFKNIVDGEN